MLLLLACASAPTDSSPPPDSRDSETDTTDTGDSWTPGPCGGWTGFEAVGTTWTWETDGGAAYADIELVELSEGLARTHAEGPTLVLDETWRCTSEGVGRLTYTYDWGEDSRVTTFEPPCVRVREDMQVGDSWSCTTLMTTDSTSEGHSEYTIEVDVAVVEAAPLTVPAGTFATIKVEETLGSYTMPFWYADGVGLVKEQDHELVAWSPG